MDKKRALIICTNRQWRRDSGWSEAFAELRAEGYMVEVICKRPSRIPGGTKVIDSLLKHGEPGRDVPKTDEPDDIFAQIPCKTRVMLSAAGIDDLESLESFIYTGKDSPRAALESIAGIGAAKAAEIIAILEGS